MCGEDLVVVLGRQVAGGTAVRQGQLRPHHDGVGKPAQQHHQRQDDVHHADLLMVDGGQPLGPQPLPSAEIRESGEDRECDQAHEPERPHYDRLIQRERVEGQLSEHGRYSLLAMQRAAPSMAAALGSLLVWCRIWSNRSGATDEKYSTGCFSLGFASAR